MATDPRLRLRRLRRTAALREAHAEVRLHPSDFVLPLFVKPSLGSPEAISAMPGVMQHTVASAVDLAKEATSLGVRSFILFGIPDHKDDVGSSGWDPAGPVPTAARAMKDALGDDIVVWADVCSCEYTDHGHCGPLTADGQVLNAPAVEGYVRSTLAYAEAGGDVVAPSGMMDGQVGAIRDGLDDAGRDDVAIVAYAAKYASAFYGPFREAAESGMAFGDRRAYQMQPGNRREAMLEVEADLAEGADVVMVKPALPYLDIVADVAANFDVPVAAYHVSGEYSMVKAAGQMGWLDADAAMAEAVLSIRRAGAGQVLTYAALDLARSLG